METAKRLTRRGMALVGVGAAAAALVASAAVPGAVQAEVSAHPTAVTGNRLVTLPTGDRIAVQTDASGAVRTARPAGPAHGSFLTRHYGSDTYVVPTTALPDLAAKRYTMAQFDVSALAAGRAGREPGAGVVRPDFPMRTATIKVLDPQGKPVDAASLSLVNTDDSRKYGGFPVTVDGQARVSVPDGHYAVQAYTYKISGDSIKWERLTFGAFTVDGAAVTTTLRTATAKNKVSVRTPKDGDALGLDLAWYRGSSDDMGLLTGYSMSADHPVYLSTSPKGTGTQHLSVHETLTSPDSAATPYLYDVDFLSDAAIGTDQNYTATPSSLATIDSRYYSDQPNRVGDSVLFGIAPWEFVQFRLGAPLTAPLHRTEYVTANPSLTYSEMVDAVSTDTAFGGTMISGNQVYRPGEKLRADWYRGPLAPGIPADTGTGYYACGACRYDDTLSILLSPVTDSTADHSGSLDDPSMPGTVSKSRFQLYQGATKITDEKDVVGGAYQVPADSADYRIVYDQTRKASWTKQSTTSHSVWRFTSEHSGATTVPDRWDCDLENGGNKDCSAVSLLLPHYRLTEGLDGAAAPGPDSMQLHLTHSAGAPQTPVESATVSISYDGGKHWTPTKLRSLGAGRYRATWTNPASSAGGNAAIRITAKDAAGGSVSQTVHDAFTITAG